MLINPGTRIGGKSDGWTNTAEAARAEAERWLTRMAGDGLAEVELLDEVNPVDGGRWQFTFRHTITGTRVSLETHGINDLDAYRQQYTFDPKVYWNGSSSGDPTLGDFAAPGFEPVQTYKPAGEADRA
jgi:hypothetical protein